ncbi:hypothetical protein O9X98_07190 [Agrobacterium salinitolerans]|nr:hypothetical protein [Agrobacterium salinitolerans]
MQSIRSINLQKNLGEVLRAADVEAVVVLNRDQPRTVVMSAEEFIRLKIAAGEPVPPEVRKSRPTLHRPQADPLGYDPSNPNHAVTVAREALAGEHEAEVRREVDGALRRWGMRK